MKATSAPAEARPRTQRPRGFWAGMRGMCLPFALFLMFLPSLADPGGDATYVISQASTDDPWLTWGNLWMIPVGWIVLNVIVVAVLWSRGRRRER